MQRNLFVFVFSLFYVFCMQDIYADWDRVYLASYPRSGNHWMRYLIEEASHVATSSVYCDHDPKHLSNPFPWGYSADHGYEGLCRYPEDGETVVIKTHYPALHQSPFDLQQHSHAIVMIRNPLECMYSFYLYVNNQKSPFPRIPKDLLIKYIEMWRRFYEYWLKQENVTIIRYEDLYEFPKSTLMDIMAILKYPIDIDDIERAVDKYPPSGGLNKHFSKYHPGDIKLVKKELSNLLELFGYSIKK